MIRFMDDKIKLTLRLTPELHAKIQEARKESGRSANEEIHQRLADSFNDPALIDRVEKTIRDEFKK